MLDKTFHFIVVVWGERFRNYFLDYCLPSLLSPGNIPAISTAPRSKFLIATRPNDWAAIKAAPSFQLLERFADPIYLEIPEQPPGRSGCEHMNEGHKLACEIAYRNRGLAMILTPDCMLSDGSITRLQELAIQGVEVVLAAALRFGEEPFLGHLHAGGLLNGKGGPLVISGRQMASAAVRGFHPETLSYEWDSPYLIDNPPAAWWSVPEDEGIVLHCLSWAPLLLDYGAVQKHDTTMLDTWTIDGDYIFKNVGPKAKIHVVRDSDEIFLASWAKMDENAWVFRKRKFLKGPLGSHVQKLMRGAQFRTSFFTPTFDPLKRKIFFEPVRWHGRPISQRWYKKEQQAAATLQRWLGNYPKHRDIAPSDLPFLSWPLIAFAHFTNFFVRALVFIEVGKLLRGDSFAWRRLSRLLNRKMRKILGQPVTELPLYSRTEGRSADLIQQKKN
jgi:hypothetical protein